MPTLFRPEPIEVPDPQPPQPPYGGSQNPSIGTQPTKPSQNPSIGTQPDDGSDDEYDGGIGAEDIPMTSASGLPFRMNPPMHPFARHVRADLGSRGKFDKSAQNAALYSETAMKFGADSAQRKGGGTSKFEDLRLGRIVQGDMVLSAAMRKANSRYGMRFLYNPEKVSGGLNVGTNFIPDQRSTGTFVLQEGLEKLSFEILINRIPDIQTNAGRNDYGPVPISKKDRDQIQERGTHYDIDFLYRCANGTHDLRSRSTTGDIGLLLPSPCNLILGRVTTRGALTSVKVDDQMFSSNMVPMLSYVTIEFTRFLSTTPEETTRLESSAGIARGSGDSGPDDDGDGDGSSSGGGGQIPNPGPSAISGKEVWNIAKFVGFTPAQADIMTQIAYKESGWVPGKHNGDSSTKDDSYGLWQINLYGDLRAERRKRWNLKKDTDLFSPAVNARAAKSLFDARWRIGQKGYEDWSVYKNGSYRDVKITWR